MMKRESTATKKQKLFNIIDPGKIALMLAAVILMLAFFNIITVLGEPEETATQPAETSGVSTAPEDPTSEPGTDPTQSEESEEPVTTPDTETPSTSVETEDPRDSEDPDGTPAKTPAPTKTPTPIPTKTPRPTDPVLPSEVPSVPVITEETPAPTPSFEDIEPGGNIDPQKDMHGYIIRIAGWWDEANTNKNIQNLVKEFEKKYNCQVLFMDMTKKKIWDKLLESKATGRPYIDAVFLEAHDVMGKMVPQGLLAPINPYYTEKEINAIPESYRKILAMGKNLYAVPAKAPNFSGIWCNVDFLTSMGIPDINKLYLNNEWTWEEFNKFMYNTTVDSDKTGYYEKFGIAVGLDIFPGLIASAGGNIISWNGKNFTVDIHNSRTFSALDFARSIHTIGYVAHESEKYFYIYRTGFLSGESWQASKVKEYLKANIFFAPYPVPLKGDPYRAMATSAPVIALVESSMYKEETAELIKLLYGAKRFEEDVENAVKDMNKESTNVYKNMLGNFTVDFSKAFVDELSLRETIMKDLKNRKGFKKEEIEEKYLSYLNNAIESRSKQINLKRLPVKMDW